MRDKKWIALYKAGKGEIRNWLEQAPKWLPTAPKRDRTQMQYRLKLLRDIPAFHKLNPPQQRPSRFALWNAAWDAADGALEEKYD